MEKSKIEWCDSTWNPISGCYHTCPYCYARGTANRFKGCDVSPDGTASADIITLKERLTVTSKAGVVRNAAYPYGFTPTLHEYRLDDPKTKGFGKTVFVCSMADMFGGAVAVSGTGQGKTPQSLVTPAFAGFPPIAENGIKAALTT